MASDIQARHHEVRARLALDAAGRMLAIDVDDIHAIGPYPQYPRSSAGEGRAVLSLSGAPYALGEAAARSRAVFTNLGMSGHYRGVGHPIAAAVTEGLVDLAARRLGADPWEMRRRNFATYGKGAAPSALGVSFEDLPFAACLDVLEARHPRSALEEWRGAARGRGLLAGYGIAVFIEMTSRGPGFYGDGDVRVSTRDYCTLRLEPNGAVVCQSSVTEQGQGVESGIAQIVAETIGLPRDRVRMVTGDTATTGHGGGTWGSRSLAIGGRAAWEAARQLRGEILEIAAELLQRPRSELSIREGEIIAGEAGTGMRLGELAALAHYRPHHLPDDRQPMLVASAAFGPRDAPFRAGCGVQLSCVEIDPETGIVRLARHAVAHFCGKVVNPLLVDGQIKGGVAQGLGAALTEELDYDAEGQLLNATLAEYRVPMAVETPDIEVHHVHPPGADSAPDGEPPRHVGVGEAGTAGASAAVMNAINDALAPRGAALWQIPATPRRVLAALDSAQR
jgi:carbon-monoxide dehydrogenase large subunit